MPTNRFTHLVEMLHRRSPLASRPASRPPALRQIHRAHEPSERERREIARGRRLERERSKAVMSSPLITMDTLPIAAALLADTDWSSANILAFVATQGHACRDAKLSLEESWGVVVARVVAESGNGPPPPDDQFGWGAAIAAAAGAPAPRTKRPPAHGLKLVPTSPRGSRLK